MAVIAEVTLRGISKDQYDTVRERTGWLSHAPDGGLAHLTWWDGDVCRNVDGWESEAAFAAFGEQRLGPVMAAMGLGEPEVAFHPAHEVFLPARVLVTATLAPGAASAAELTSAAYAAFAAGDVAAVLARFAPDIAWTTPDSLRHGGLCTGPQEVAAFFGHLAASYSELAVVPETVIDGGDIVTVQGVHRGTTVAGTEVDIPFVHVWTWRDGLATSFVEYFDATPLLADLGRESASTAARL